MNNRSPHEFSPEVIHMEGRDRSIRNDREKQGLNHIDVSSYPQLSTENVDKKSREDEKLSTSNSQDDHDVCGHEMASWVAHHVASISNDRSMVERRRRTSDTTITYSSARPDRRDPVKLSSAFSSLVKRKKWSTNLQLRQLLIQWSDLVGTMNAKHSTPSAFEKGLLHISCDSTAWATQLRMMSAVIMKRINEQMGEVVVTSIKVDGPHHVSWKKGPRSIRDGRGPRDTYG